jgi:hypothetical protein
MRAWIWPKGVDADKSAPCEDIHIHVANRKREDIRIGGSNIQVKHNLLLRCKHVMYLLHVDSREGFRQTNNERRRTTN